MSNTYRDYGTTCPQYVYYTAERAHSDLLPEGPKWSARFAPPAVGSRIRIRFNRLGTAVVTGYFEEAGWLGILCRLDDAPDWHRKQNQGDPTAHVFGAEIEPLPSEA